MASLERTNVTGQRIERAILAIGMPFQDASARPTMHRAGTNTEPLGYFRQSQEALIPQTLETTAQTKGPADILNPLRGKGRAEVGCQAACVKLLGGTCIGMLG